MVLITAGGCTLRARGQILHLEPGHLCLSQPGSAIEIDLEQSDELRLAEIRFSVSDRDLKNHLSELPAVVTDHRDCASAAFRALIEEGLERREYYAEMLNLGLGRLLLDILRTRSAARIPERERPQPIPTPRRPFSRAEAHMRAHYAEHITLTALASLENVTPAYFCRVFRQAYGIPPIHYLLRLRIQKARELLSTSSLTVTDIAQRVGFSSVHYFSRYFAKVHGVPPVDFRAGARADPSDVNDLRLDLPGERVGCVAAAPGRPSFRAREGMLAARR